VAGDRYRLVVYGYPRGSTREQQTIDFITDLVCVLKDRYGIDLPISLLRGSADYPNFCSLLVEFLDSCREGPGYIDAMWVYYLAYVAKYPTPETVDAVRQFSQYDQDPSRRFDFSVLRPWLVDRILANPTAWGPPPLAQFLATENTQDLPGKRGQGDLWGTELPCYPVCTAIERNGQCESVYHAVLHLFGVEEGYDRHTKVTTPGCEKCWMQWVPTSGSGLCQTHQNELRAFLQRVKP